MLSHAFYYYSLQKKKIQKNECNAILFTDSFQYFTLVLSSVHI